MWHLKLRPSASPKSYVAIVALCLAYVTKALRDLVNHDAELMRAMTRDNHSHDI